MDTDGSNQTRLTNDRATDCHANWSRGMVPSRWVAALDGAVSSQPFPLLQPFGDETGQR